MCCLERGSEWVATGLLRGTCKVSERGRACTRSRHRLLSDKVVFSLRNVYAPSKAVTFIGFYDFGVWPVQARLVALGLFPRISCRY